MLVRFQGRQAIVGKRPDGTPEFAPGERVLFIPSGCTLPLHMAEDLGVVSYLSRRVNARGEHELVVRQVRLRGESSCGLLVATDDSGRRY